MEAHARIGRLSVDREQVQEKEEEAAGRLKTKRAEITLGAMFLV